MKLGYGACSGTRHHEVGRAVGTRHIGDERHGLYIVVSGCRAGALFGIELACLPHHLISASGGKTVKAGGNTVVDGARAKASTYHQQQRTGRVKPESALGCGAVHPGTVGYLFSHRISGLGNDLGGEEALHAVVGHADCAGLRREKLVCDSRIRVLFLNKRRDALTLCLLEYGAAGISAHAYGNVGTEVPDDAARAKQTPHKLHHHRHVAPETTAVETRHGQSFYLISGGRHTLHLHAAACAHKENLGAGLAAAYGVGYGNGGENVSAGASTAYQYAFR